MAGENAHETRVGIDRGWIRRHHAHPHHDGAGGDAEEGLAQIESSRVRFRPASAPPAMSQGNPYQTLMVRRRVPGQGRPLPPSVIGRLEATRSLHPVWLDEGP